MTKTLIARWESRSGKHWVDLYRDELGYTYKAPGQGGNLGALSSDSIAVRMIELRLENFQPDANTTPMRRVAPCICVPVSR